ncbi:MAG: carboxylating nicotinate-nucleotide diphosphorylase [Negativicutes bacterium]|jgi:nicotinate-nucleotide pyrophosphorylase (carboxylating)
MIDLHKEYLTLIQTSFHEDFGDFGDISVEAVFNDSDCTQAVLLSKADGVLAGVQAFELTFKTFDNSTHVVLHKKDGDKIFKGDVIAEVSGRTKTVLMGERTAINIIAFMSGIATQTALCVEAAKTSGHALILDTRKTLPGWRRLSKYAVRCGGGSNHRMGLYDMVMLKDNHIDAAGGISAAVGATVNRWGNRFAIEVETRNLDEVRQAVEAHADWIMLDNMDNETMRQAVKIINGRAKVEASGNMTIERIAGVSATGVDFISIGSLTHSVEAFDFSLRIK